VWLWTVQTRSDSGWTTEILPAAQRVHRLAEGVDRVYVTAVDRVGNQSVGVTVRVGP